MNQAAKYHQLIDYLSCQTRSWFTLYEYSRYQSVEEKIGQIGKAVADQPM